MPGIDFGSKPAFIFNQTTKLGSEEGLSKTYEPKRYTSIATWHYKWNCQVVLNFNSPLSSCNNPPPTTEDKILHCLRLTLKYTYGQERDTNGLQAETGMQTQCSLAVVLLCWLLFMEKLKEHFSHLSLVVSVFYIHFLTELCFSFKRKHNFWAICLSWSLKLEKQEKWKCDLLTFGGCCVSLSL